MLSCVFRRKLFFLKKEALTQHQEKEKRILMNKRLFDKRCHYSIRKFAIGAASGDDWG